MPTDRPALIEATSMSNKQTRNTLRLVHLIVASLMAVFIYSPLRLDDTFAAVIQALVVPIVVITGVVMWQQPLVMKLLNRGRRAESPRSN